MTAHVPADQSASSRGGTAPRSVPLGLRRMGKMPMPRQYAFFNGLLVRQRYEGRFAA